MFAKAAATSLAQGALQRFPPPPFFSSQNRKIPFGQQQCTTFPSRDTKPKRVETRSKFPCATGSVFQTVPRNPRVSFFLVLSVLARVAELAESTPQPGRSGKETLRVTTYPVMLSSVPAPATSNHRDAYPLPNSVIPNGPAPSGSDQPAHEQTPSSP